MFIVKFKDGTIFPASSVEENYRLDADSNSYIALTMQNSDAVALDSLETYKSKLTKDNIMTISVYDETGKTLITTYTGYCYIRYLTSRILPTGKIVYDFNFTKVNPFNN